VTFFDENHDLQFMPFITTPNGSCDLKRMEIFNALSKWKIIL
jgi:hypothetical protein